MAFHRQSVRKDKVRTSWRRFRARRYVPKSSDFPQCSNMWCNSTAEFSWTLPLDHHGKLHSCWTVLSWIPSDVRSWLHISLWPSDFDVGGENACTCWDVGRGEATVLPGSDRALGSGFSRAEWTESVGEVGGISVAPAHESRCWGKGGAEILPWGFLLCI